jgi:activator of 2-hydroxyglutaryl-CoA dehydratase
MLLANKKQKKKMNKKMNHLGIDVGKRKCRAALKDHRAKILDELFFGNNSDGILELFKRIYDHGTKKCKCSTGIYRKHVDMNTRYIVRSITKSVDHQSEL